MEQYKWYRSGLLGFVEGGGDAIFADYVNYSSPARVHISVGGRCYYLVQFVPQFLGFHAFPVVGLADGHQFLASGTSALESFDHALGADGVVAGQDGHSVVESCNDGLDDPGSESRWVGEYLLSKRE